MLTAGQIAPTFEKRPVFGLPVSVPHTRYSTVICFVRGLGSPLTREALSLLQDRWAEFDELGHRIVAITDSPASMAQDFVPRYHVLFPVICDPGQELFKLYEVGGHIELAGNLRGLAGSARSAFRALRHGHGPLERNHLKLPAQFCVASDGRLTHARYGRAMTDVPEIDDLLAAC
ncbi:MAG: redoxin domain-containing protein [Proteobacteria bacterium]|nr:redoxin domain-containing protein [Pseudomonadota bacterium]MCP4917507.1 redoxin domain-containing protein [Pseudomonadota bacterium]